MTTSYPNLIRALTEIAESHPTNAAVRTYLTSLQQDADDSPRDLHVVRDPAPPFAVAAAR